MIHSEQTFIKIKIELITRGKQEYMNVKKTTTGSRVGGKVSQESTPTIAATANHSILVGNFIQINFNLEPELQ